MVQLEQLFGPEIHKRKADIKQKVSEILDAKEKHEEAQQEQTQHEQEERERQEESDADSSSASEPEPEPEQEEQVYCTLTPILAVGTSQHCLLSIHTRIVMRGKNGSFLHPRRSVVCFCLDGVSVGSCKHK